MEFTSGEALKNKGLPYKHSGNYRKLPEIEEHASKITGTKYSAGDGYKGQAFRHLQRNPVHRKHK